MNVSVVIVSSLLAGISARAAAPVPRTVKVCLDVGSTTLFVVIQAEAKAARMFADIGVKIEWLHGQLDCKVPRNETILIRLSSDSRPDFLPGSLAYALPYEGAHIEIFSDRVMRIVEPRRRVDLFAHVLAHELGHILQGVSRHSEQGLMKANWNEADFMHMSWEPLPFTALDVLLIQQGLDKRASQLATR